MYRSLFYSFKVGYKIINFVLLFGTFILYMIVYSYILALHYLKKTKSSLKKVKFVKCLIFGVKMLRKHYNTISILLISLPYPIGKITTITMISVRKFLRMYIVQYIKIGTGSFLLIEIFFFCAILLYVNCNTEIRKWRIFSYNTRHQFSASAKYSVKPQKSKKLIV